MCGPQAKADQDRRRDVDRRDQRPCDQVEDLETARDDLLRRKALGSSPAQPWNGLDAYVYELDGTTHPLARPTG